MKSTVESDLESNKSKFTDEEQILIDKFNLMDDLANKLVFYIDNEINSDLFAKTESFDDKYFDELPLNLSIIFMSKLLAFTQYNISKINVDKLFKCIQHNYNLYQAHKQKQVSGNNTVQ